MSQKIHFFFNFVEQVKAKDAEGFVFNIFSFNFLFAAFLHIAIETPNRDCQIFQKDIIQNNIFVL